MFTKKNILKFYIFLQYFFFMVKVKEFYLIRQKVCENYSAIAKRYWFSFCRRIKAKIFFFFKFIRKRNNFWKSYIYHTGHGKFLSHMQILGEFYLSIGTMRKPTIYQKNRWQSRYLKTHETQRLKRTVKYKGFVGLPKFDFAACLGTACIDGYIVLHWKVFPQFK